MEKYEEVCFVGDGTFGSVSKAVDLKTREEVAIKKMKKDFKTWDEAMNLRELKALRKLNHPNIVKLNEVLRVKDTLYFVFEFMGSNLYEWIKNRGGSLSETDIKVVAY